MHNNIIIKGCRDLGVYQWVMGEGNVVWSHNGK